MIEMILLTLAALALHCLSFGLAFKRGLSRPAPHWHSKASYPKPGQRGCALFQACAGIALIIALALTMAACLADAPAFPW